MRSLDNDNDYNFNIVSNKNIFSNYFNIYNYKL